MKVLVLNCGGSSIKYRLYAMPQETVLAGGSVERVGLPGARLSHQVGEAAPVTETLECPTHAVGIQRILALLVDGPNPAVRSLAEIEAAGHRVVHAGDRYTGSVRITPDVIRALYECVALAPLHNPPNLAGIEACQEVLPGVPMVAVFDNTLHHTLPDYARAYAIPRDLAQRHGIRRYGFHGIAFRYATQRTAALLGRPLESLRLVTLMLGSGCTANAMKGGRSLDVSTGLTPLEGLMQSTRSGDLDPAVVTFLQEKEGLSAAAVNALLNRQSGWLGLSGVSADLREVRQAAAQGNDAARLALQAFTYRARKYVGAYAAVLGGLDALTFTGGVGERAPDIRAAICDDLRFLGISLDPERNAVTTGDGLISTPDSPTPVVVVTMDEECVIARDTYALVANVQ
ncbi:MAG: acetate kinase [Armatimonadetes bacterium]|nr:acetate kinase [Armatimonadota bacterium]